MSEPTQTTDQPDRPRHTRLVIILAVIAIPIAVFFVWRFKTQATLNKMIDDIKAQGYPVTCAELNTWYKLPDDANNGADVVMEAFDKFHKWDKPASGSDLPYVGDANRPGRDTAMDADTLKLAQKYLATNAASLELLHKLPQYQHFRYPVDLSKGLGVDINYFTSIRKMAFLLSLEAAASTDAGDADAAVTSIDSLLALSDSLRTEPTLISQLVRYAVQALAVKSLERTTNRIDFDKEHLSRLIDMFDRTRNSGGLTRALVGERCYFIDCIKGTASLTDPGNSVPKPTGLGFYRAIGLANRDGVRYLTIVDDWINCLKLPPQQQRDHAAELNKQLQSIPRSYVLVHVLAPAFSKIITLSCRADAALDCTRTALEVQLFRVTKGKVPASLAELVTDQLKAIPADPFDGKPLRYKKLDTGGFVVYSVGDDLTDNQGLERPPKTSGDKPWDITFIIER